MNIRETIEEREKEILSPYATKSADTKGRERYEAKCEIRTEFQRDRDRIMYSKAFRRLKHKTQVFLSPEGDHYRTRLTHTLEVSQIARSIARALGLNEDLTEAVALGHDLGHTPFGHAGEKALNNICPYGFKHNEHSLRVVDVLEKTGGLNLTQEVRNGILCHTGSQKAFTLEGQVVALSDKIAYINHDIDDAIRGGVLVETDLPKKFTDVLGENHSKRINTMIWAVVKESDNKPQIGMDTEIYDAMMGMRQFLFENVYISSEPKIEERKAKHIIEGLYEAYLKNPDLIPNNESDIHSSIRDYIAGMSDRYAVSKYSEIYIPKFWNL